jgi:hypothetical protein
MFLITSGSYVDSDLQSEFGLLPPCFLPVGNRRLFQHQLSFLPKGHRVIITIPESYDVGSFDRHYLQENGAELLMVPDGLKLGESIVFALNLLEVHQENDLNILHGDTLISQFPEGQDMIGISEVADNYNWAVLDENESGPLLATEVRDSGSTGYLIANGYFHFSQPQKLIRALTESRWDFVAGINRYHEIVGLQPKQTDNWLDFGHILTYYHSKSKLTTQRQFNEMVITPRKVVKTSQRSEKLRAEANWYQSIPSELRAYTPHFFWERAVEAGYQYAIEYLPLIALNELYVFARLPAFGWKEIISACLNLIEENGSHQSPHDAAKCTSANLFREKTTARLQEFASQHQLSLDDKWTINQELGLSLNAMVEESSKYLPEEDAQYCVMHGDFCFSNILYDFRTRSIKVIDPRGINNQGQFTVYGDSRYDIAKLAHSVIGLYDQIVAGYYTLKRDGLHVDFSLETNPTQESVIHLFKNAVHERFGLSERELIAMQIHLFLSMLPLHSDDTERQFAFVANAFRLYSQIMETSS